MTVDLKKALGNKIVELRQEKKLTQKQLAELINFKIIGISQLERGLKFTSENTILKLCKVFDCEPVDLFNFSANKVILSQEQKKKVSLIEKMLELYPDNIENIYEILSQKIGK